MIWWLLCRFFLPLTNLLESMQMSRKETLSVVAQRNWWILVSLFIINPNVRCQETFLYMYLSIPIDIMNIFLYCLPLGVTFNPPQPCGLGHYCPLQTPAPDRYPCPPGTFTNSSSLYEESQCSVCTEGYYCIGKFQSHSSSVENKFYFSQ